VFVGFLYFSINHKNISYKWVIHFVKIIPQKYKGKIQNFSYNFIEGLAILNNRFTDVVFILFLTILAVLSESYFIFLIFSEFGSSITFVKILFGYTLLNLTYILPTPPAQIGSNQFMWLLIFSFTLGINENLTGAAVTFSHILTSLIIFILGTISLFFLKIKFKNVIKIKKLNEDRNE